MIVTQSAAAEIDLSEYETGDHDLSYNQTCIESPRRNLCPTWLLSTVLIVSHNL